MGRPDERNHFEGLGNDGTIIIKWMDLQEVRRGDRLD